MYDFDEIIDRIGSDCVKYDGREMVFGTNDVIPMWVADMDFASADFIVDAIKERADHRVFGYTYRSEDYDRSIQGWLSRRSGWQVRREWLAYSPGVVLGVTCSMVSCTRERDGVLIQQPVYHPFGITINANNRKVVNSELALTKHGYRIDFEDFEEKLKTVKAFILCNPHNPTGRAFTESELRRMGELCVKHGVRIISDEIHSDFVYSPGKHIHIASLSPEIAEQTITFVAPSKSFNLAGLCTAVAITSSEQIMKEYKAELHKIHLESSNIFGAVALKAAYSKGDRWMDEMKEYLEGNIDFVIDFLKRNIPSIKCHKPESTYLMWLDFRQWNMSQDELNDFLVNKARIGITDGSIFGGGGNGFQRMNIGTRRAVIAEALDRLAEAVRKNIKDI